MRLILIRHALPEQSETTDDPDLSEEGRQQAAALARALQHEQIDAVWTSPLRRAVQTAEPLARHRGLPPREHAGLVEFDFGHGAYIPAENIAHPLVQAMKTRLDDQSGDAEIAAFQHRVVTAVGDVEAATGPRETAAIVCHGGVVNAYVAHALEIRRVMFSNIAYTGFTIVHVGVGSRIRVVSLNEHQHLRRR